MTTSDPDVLGSIPLRTAARQKVVTQIPVTNPTSSPVDVTVRCSNPRTFATNEKTTIPPRGVAQVGVAYAPIAAETDAVSDVVLESDALGTWPYVLKLSATAAGPERGVSFTVPLGSAETKKVPFRHFLEAPATFEARWRGGGNGGAFVLGAETHQAPGATTLDERNEGVEQHIDVTFEPTSLGSQFRDVLLLTSETGGSTSCPSPGGASRPSPPVRSPSAAAALRWRLKTRSTPRRRSFVPSDNPAFIVTREETIGAKQTKQIGVRFEPREDGKAVRTAKLLVTSDRVPGAPWAFYLKAAD